MEKEEIVYIINAIEYVMIKWPIFNDKNVEKQLALIDKYDGFIQSVTVKTRFIENNIVTITALIPSSKIIEFQKDKN